MALFFTSLIIITCILLVIIILVQNPKGGGLSSSFGGSGTQLFGGVKKTTDFLDKGTWFLSILLVALVLAMNVMIAPAGGPVEDEEGLQTELPATQAPVQPQAPAGQMPQPVE